MKIKIISKLFINNLKHVSKSREFRIYALWQRNKIDIINNINININFPLKNRFIYTTIFSNKMNTFVKNF